MLRELRRKHMHGSFILNRYAGRIDAASKEKMKKGRADGGNGRWGRAVACAKTALVHLLLQVKSADAAESLCAADSGLAQHSVA